MTVKVRPYRKGGFEVDIRFDTSDGTPFRERRRAPVASRSGAKRWGEARERELLLRGSAPVEVVPQRKEVPTLAEFAPKFIEHAKATKQKPSSIDSKQSVLDHHLIPHLGGVRLDDITTERVDMLKAAFSASSPKSVNNRLSVLSTLLKTAIRWKLLPSMPCLIELVKVDEEEAGFYEPDQYYRLVAAAARCGPDVLVMVLLGGDAGLRRGEIMGLRQCDINFERRLLTVAKSIVRGNEGSPKGRRTKSVPMTEALAKALKGHRHLRGERVLCQEDGAPLTPKMIRRMMEKAQRLAGLEATGSVHILRHSFCSHLAMRGAPARAIQDLARHAHMMTTARYMHLGPSSLEAAVRLLDEARAEATSGPGRGDIVETALARR
jgi:integrase